VPRLLNGLTHPEAATQYARDVVDGTIVACKFVKQACLRHLNDLVRSETTDYPYVYDHKKAQRFCTFFEKLPHVEGKWAARKELLVMEPWQCFIACSIFGWVKKSDGYRRFKRAYCCVPRKNGKSAFAAVIADFMLVLDGEHGAQVYSGATSKDQASFVFNPAKKMLEQSPAICKKYGVVVNADSVTVMRTNSKFVRLIGNPGDGSSPHGYICDEHHEAEDSLQYDTMTSGMGAREQPLAFVITTAGFNTAGPCYLLQKDMEKILEGSMVAETRFAIIYTCDLEAYTFNGQDFEPDDWTSEAALIKANPNWGTSVNIADALEEQREAIISTEKQNLFKTKKLNIWCFARNGFFNVAKWINCFDKEMKREDFLGKPCIKGLDLGSQIDLTADVTVFQKMNEADNTLHYYIFGRYYVPEATVELPTNQHYQKWVHDGALIATPGDEIDYPTVRTNILVDVAEFDVKEFAFDSHQATLMKQEIIEETGIEAGVVTQNAQTLNIPMKWLQAMMTSGRLHHDGNPVLTWCVSNTISREDRNENDFPNKERPENKIDGVSAMLCAFSRIRAVLGETGDGKFVYNGM